MPRHQLAWNLLQDHSSQILLGLAWLALLDHVVVLAKLDNIWNALLNGQLIAIKTDHRREIFVAHTDNHY